MNQAETGARVIARYAEPHRRYHGTEHLASVLAHIDEFATDAHDLFLVRLAAFYHDAIYDIPFRELTNEEASARLSVRELSRTGLGGGGPERGVPAHPADRDPRTRFA